MISRSVCTSIQIAAPAETVWRVLTDFAAYGEWNPFILSVKGPLEVGATLSFAVAAPAGQVVEASAQLLTLSERELAWGGGNHPLLFQGRHSFMIEPRGNHVICSNVERFTGLLVPWYIKPARLKAQRMAFEQQDLALKSRAESLMVRKA